MANMIDFGFGDNGGEEFNEPFERGRRELV
jgi:hypothetical protein